jgi:hypothetical protein
MGLRLSSSLSNGHSGNSAGVTPSSPALVYTSERRFLEVFGKKWGRAVFGGLRVRWDENTL